MIGDVHICAMAILAHCELWSELAQAPGGADTVEVRWLCLVMVPRTVLGFTILGELIISISIMIEMGRGVEWESWKVLSLGEHRSSTAVQCYYWWEKRL